MPDFKHDMEAFRVARSLAIEAYAELESELCYVFAVLIGVQEDTAAIVFFKITNADARNKIIEALLEHVHGDKFDTYWNGQPGEGAKKRIPGLFTLISQLDRRRNEIVHWHPVDNSASEPDGSTKRWGDLRPPFFWARSDAPPIETEHFNEFTERAHFVERSLRKFWWCLRFPHKMPADELQAWTQIFQQPVTYPPSEAHPLYRKPKA